MCVRIVDLNTYAYMASTTDLYLACIMCHYYWYLSSKALVHAKKAYGVVKVKRRLLTIRGKGPRYR
jgi:hypothetical protein